MFLILYTKVTDNVFAWSDGFNQFIQAVVKVPKVYKGTKEEKVDAAVVVMHLKP